MEGDASLPPHRPPPPLRIKQTPFLPCSGYCASLLDAMLSSFSIYARFVVRVLVLERVMGVAGQAWVGLGAQYLLQCCYGAAVLWEASQSPYRFQARTLRGI